MSIPSLNQAIREGKNLATIEELVREVSIDETDEARNTPLMTAIQEGKDAIAEFLIDEGAKIRCTNDEKQTALHIAARLNRIAIAKILAQKDHELIHKFDYTYRSTPLIIAVEKGHLDIVRDFVEIRPSALNGKDYNGTPFLHIAARGGFFDLAKYILDQRPISIEEKDSRDETPLHHAAEHGNLELVQLLVDRGVDILHIDMDGESAFIRATFSGKLEVAQFLAERAPELIFIANTASYSPLHACVVSNNCKVEMVDFLIQQKAAVNACALRGITPLYLATKSNQEAVVQALLTHDANPNVFSHKKKTPLHVAAKKGHEQVLKLLIENRAKVDTECAAGESPLTLAIQKSHPHIVDRLLVAGANPKGVPPRGLDPMEVAIDSWNLADTPLRDIIRSLLIAGAEAPWDDDVIEALGGENVVQGLTNTFKGLPSLRQFSGNGNINPQKKQKT